MQMNDRQRLIFMLDNFKQQGKRSVTLDIDTVLAALHTPVISKSKQAEPENWEADGGIWNGPDDH
jgi:hypothetical protein